MTDQYANRETSEQNTARKKTWSAPVLTQLGVPATQSGSFTNINENLFFFFGGMCSNMVICPS
jgi:hypothetical protein